MEDLYESINKSLIKKLQDRAREVYKYNFQRDTDTGVEIMFKSSFNGLHISKVPAVMSKELGMNVIVEIVDQGSLGVIYSITPC